MYALRERRVHVTQEDFELAVAKVNSVGFLNIFLLINMFLGYAKRFGEKCFIEKTLEVIKLLFFPLLSSNLFALGLFFSVCYYIKKDNNK